jgi:hypothetical protein
VDGTFLGKTGLFGAALATRPAKPGDIVVLYGANFGPTNPPLPIGRGVSAASPLVDAPRVTIGGVEAPVLYGGGAPNLIGTYQFNITVPDVPNGDQAVVVETGACGLSRTLSSQSNAEAKIMKISLLFMLAALRVFAFQPVRLRAILALPVTRHAPNATAHFR